MEPSTWRSECSRWFLETAAGTFSRSHQLGGNKTITCCYNIFFGVSGFHVGRRRRNGSILLSSQAVHSRYIAIHSTNLNMFDTNQLFIFATSSFLLNTSAKSTAAPLLVGSVPCSHRPRLPVLLP